MSLKKFLIMVEDDVVTELIFDDFFGHNKKLYDALKEQVSVIEVDFDTDVSFNDTYDGTNFIKAEDKDCYCDKCSKGL